MATELRDQLQSSLGGAFTLERELTGGGSSRAFLAGDAALNRRIVVKVLDGDLADAISGERFTREIAAVAGLQHPCIVPLLAAGDAGGVPYYTMPVVEGETLRARLARDGALPVADAVHVLRDILSALSYAHARGIYHRDLRPENVLLTPHRAMVAGLGVALALTRAARERLSLGDPAYVAPEQALRDPAADHRADLYALGVTAYEMLAGEHPFAEQSAAGRIAALAMHTPIPLSRHRPGAPSSLVALVTRLLEKDPARRPQTADEILLTLEHTLTPSGGMPLVGVRLTPPDPRATQPRVPAWLDWAVHWRWQRVPRHLAAILAAGVLVAAAGLLAFRWSGGATGRSERRMLLVLPFENVGDSSRGYMAEGITDELAGRLGRLAGVGVVGRATAAGFQSAGKSPAQLARELHVTHILSGTVRWDDAVGATSRFRVAPELVRVSDSRQVWSQSYDVVPADVFRMQADIAEQVARSAGVSLAPDEAGLLEHPATTNLQAYDFYLRARHLTRQAGADSIRLAIGTYRRALALDSGFALAWSGLARAWSALADVHVPARVAYPQVRLAATRAVALDSSIGEAQMLLGAAQLFHDWQPLDARMQIERALLLDPGSGDGMAIRGAQLLASGEPDSALAALGPALARDPLSIAATRWTVLALNATNRNAEAPAVARRFSEAAAPGDAHAALEQSEAFAVAGDYSRMRDAARAALPAGPAAQAYLGFAEARLGRKDEARRIARGLAGSKAWVNPALVAIVYSGLGDADNALRFLEQAYADRSCEMLLLGWAIWDPLRGDRGFQALEKKVGLPRR